MKLTDFLPVFIGLQYKLAVLFSATVTLCDTDLSKYGSPPDEGMSFDDFSNTFSYGDCCVCCCCSNSFCWRNNENLVLPNTKRPSAYV